MTEDTNFSYKENANGKVLLWTAIDFSDPEKESGEVRVCSTITQNMKNESIFTRVLDKEKLDPVETER